MSAIQFLRRDIAKTRFITTHWTKWYHNFSLFRQIFDILLSKFVKSLLFEQLQNCSNIVWTKCRPIIRTINCSNNTPTSYYRCSKQLQGLYSKERDRRKRSLCRIRAFVNVLNIYLCSLGSLEVISKVSIAQKRCFFIFVCLHLSFFLVMNSCHS
jgi:hypothetical protein